MSAVEVRILGDGSFAGTVADIGNYTVSEDGSPLGMGDLSGGVGGASFTVVDDPSFNGSMLLPGQPFQLLDPHAGYLQGVIEGGTVADEAILSLTASSRLLPLVSTRAIAPSEAPLSSVISALCAMCGITDGIQIEPGLASVTARVPAWEGEVWTLMKQLMVVHKFEMAVVDGVIVARSLRQRWVDVTRYESTNLTYDRTGASHIVEVYYYNNEWQVLGQAHPDPDEPLADRSIISVGANETSTTNIPVNMWIESVEQPTHVVSLPWDPSGSSAYSVVDKDGNPVSQIDWANGGGLVLFEVGADHKSVDVTVRGATSNHRAPYRIASSSADRGYQYSALVIRATGMKFKREMVWSPTGVSLENAPADAVTIIDEPIVSTHQQAIEVLSQAVRENRAANQSLEVTASAVNRRGETGVPLTPTFAEWHAVRPSIATFASFNAAYSGESFGDFAEDNTIGYRNAFANQAFGGVCGARVRHRDNIYRIRSATLSPGRVSWSADPDLLFSDWEAGGTFSDFSAKWAGKSFESFGRMPLA